MKNDVFQILDSFGAFGGGLGTMTLLKIGFYSIFKKFWDHNE